MPELPTFVPTGENRLPRKGEYFLGAGREICVASDDHYSNKFDIYRAVPPEPRVIERDGKRWVFVATREPRLGEFFMTSAFSPDRLMECKCSGLTDRDIYEPIRESQMLKHVIAGLDPEPPKVVRWSLNTKGSSICLMADAGDGPYYVFTVRTDGTAIREPSVPKTLGLTLDSGRIKLVE